MEQQLHNNQQQVYDYVQPQMPQENAPYSVVTLVMGILSLVTGCFCAGLVLGIIGVVYGSKGKKEVSANPRKYKGTGMLKAGHILSIIGLVLGAVSFICVLISLAAGVAYFEWVKDLCGLDF